MNNESKLTLLAHGTDGSDGIKEGVHLRCGFDSKMGFPSEGLVFFRRKSDLKKRTCLDFHKLPSNNSIKTPFFYPLKNKYSIKLQTQNSKELDIKSFQLHGKPLQVLNGLQEFEIEIKEKNCQIDFEFFVTEKTEFTITAIETRTQNPFKIKTKTVKQNIFGSQNQIKKITFNGDANKFSMRGTGIFLKSVCCWMCDDENPWEGPINGKCGFGLPFNQINRPHATIPVEKSHNLLDSLDKSQKCLLEKVKNEYTADWIQKNTCDKDWGMASCRLGPENNCNFDEENFDELKQVIGTMNGDGVIYPVGWNAINLNDDGENGQESDTSEIEISPYDILLTKSVNPDIAKILGIYWIDDTVDDNNFYDYKVAAYWPPDTLWRLEHEITFDDYDITHIPFPWFYKENVLLICNRPGIVQNISPLLKTAQGLSFSDSQDFDEQPNLTLYFPKPVKEIQVFLTQEGTTTKIQAFSEFFSNTPLDENHITARNGVLSVHSEKPIQSVRIFGSGLTIHRIHYDFEYISDGCHEYLVCGIKKQPQSLLESPTNLKVKPLTGITSLNKEDGSILDHRYRAGLHWDVDEVTPSGFVTNSPVSYHVKRITPRNDEVLITKDEPITVPSIDPESLEGLDNEQKSQILSENRIHFEDVVDENGRYDYQVAAVDIFGRQSSFTSKISVELKTPVPPPPTNVVAKYLDYSTFDQTSDTFSDPNLTIQEKEWLKTNNTSAIVVRWQWSKELQQQAPDASKFFVYFKKDWLNLVRGKITGITPKNLGSEGNGFELQTDTSINGNLATEWLRQEKKTFQIHSNTTGSNSKITIYEPPVPLTSRPSDGSFTLPLTKLKDVDGGEVIDYRIFANWPARSKIAEMDVVVPSQQYYEIYIPSDFIFPDPPFDTEAETESDKVRYAQIAVNTFSEKANDEGSVSSPFTIIAVFRKKPSAPTFSSSANTTTVDEDVEPLMATVPDVHGKSSFALRWPRPSANSNLKFYIYRAMDKTLFEIDKQMRPLRRASFYADFWQEHSEFSEGSVSANISPGPYPISAFDKNKFQDPNPDYSSFTNKMLMALASLPDNVAAFGKLNEKPIDPLDHQYDNHPTEISDPLESNHNQLLYEDNNFDGRENVRYFYCVKVIDEIGNTSSFSLPTLPVETPQITLLSQPTITEISAGNKTIIIKWNAKLSPNMLGYMVYKTNDKQKSNDVRKMIAIKQDASDNYLIPIQPSTNQLEYVDDVVESNRYYFYGLVAIRSDYRGRKIHSMVSTIKVGQAFENNPEHPTSFTASRISRIISNEITEQGVLLTWDPAPNDIKIQIQRRVVDSFGWIPVNTEWLQPGISNYFDNSTHSGTYYEYRLSVRNHSGLYNIQYNVVTVST